MREARHPLFQFQGFQLYRAGQQDCWLAQLWTDMDPHHHETTPAEFWVENAPGVESYLLRDRDGWLFFSRLQRRNIIARRTPGVAESLWSAVELHIQFGPAEGERVLKPVLDRTPYRQETAAMQTINRERTIAGLVRGMEWLELALAGAGVSALFFDSENPNLIRFSQKRLGFAQEGTKLLKWIIPPSGESKKTGTRS